MFKSISLLAGSYIELLIYKFYFLNKDVNKILK